MRKSILIRQESGEHISLQPPRRAAVPRCNQWSPMARQQFRTSLSGIVPSPHQRECNHNQTISRLLSPLGAVYVSSFPELPLSRRIAQLSTLSNMDNDISIHEAFPSYFQHIDHRPWMYAHIDARILVHVKEGLGVDAMTVTSLVAGFVSLLLLAWELILFGLRLSDGGSRRKLITAQDHPATTITRKRAKSY